MKLWETIYIYLFLVFSSLVYDFTGMSNAAETARVFSAIAAGLITYEAFYYFKSIAMRS